MILGDYQIDLVLDGHFWLDAGSIFGVVPRTIWEKRVFVDERHRMRLAVRCLLVRDGKRTILIDSGQGNKQNEKFRDRYSVEQPFTLLDNLAKLGVKSEDVTDVVNCHLHFDHAGWNTIREGGKPDGAIIPTFPNARYWSQRKEWERAQAFTTQRDAGSFLPEDFIPLEEPRWELTDGEKPIIKGIELLVLPGHSLDTQGVLIQAGDEKVAFLGDLTPTRHHLNWMWIAAYDLHPTRTLETKRRILPRAVREKWLCVMGHDNEVPAGLLVEGDKGEVAIVRDGRFVD